MRRRVLIMGAAGRDFHNFNTYFRDNEDYDVVGFTATQIPDIEGRKYPAILSGELYPDGIPIYPEEELGRLIVDNNVDEVVFAYSDVSHEYVMHKASLVAAWGADFVILGPLSTMLQSEVPVIAVTAVRTGAGKSQTTRKIAESLTDRGLDVVVVRHPMPYGKLDQQVVQRFATYEDLDRHKCTVEEREDYELHINRGNIVYAGVDYERILEQAEQEADVIIWDGGNNDTPFYAPDYQVTVVDPHRPGHEVTYHPGEANLRMADAVIINKVSTADPEDVNIVRANIGDVNPDALIIEADSPVVITDPELVRGRRAIVVEDGPTLTHGGMSYGAGVIAAGEYDVAEIVDPRPFAVGTVKDTFARFPHLGNVLPAMGYSPQQINELRETINSSDADVVIVGTPVDLTRVMELNKPSVRVRYELRERGDTSIADLIYEEIFEGEPVL